MNVDEKLREIARLLTYVNSSKGVLTMQTPESVFESIKEVVNTS